MTGTQKLPSSFISYTWEDADHKAWVRDLAARITENGVHVVLDQWDLKYGDDLPHFMETSVRESDHVIIVCTPTYARKADQGKGGAGYEKRVVTGEMFTCSNSSKFIPLVRRGSDDEALPSFLKSKNYIDFRNDAQYALRLQDLLHQLHGIPEYPRPRLGQSPFPRTESVFRGDRPTGLPLNGVIAPDVPPTRPTEQNASSSKQESQSTNQIDDWTWGSEPNCPECGTYATRRYWILSPWSCAVCGWKGRSAYYYGRLVYLDKTKTYECPKCRNHVKPRIEVTGGSDDGKLIKDQCCPRCHTPLPHDLLPIA